MNCRAVRRARGRAPRRNRYPARRRTAKERTISSLAVALRNQANTVSIWSRVVRTALFSIAIFIVCLAAQPVSAKIVHRWSFDKDSADSVGGAHARLEDGAAVKDGQVSFDGQNKWI